MKKIIIATAFALFGFAAHSYAATPKSAIPVTVEEQFSHQFSDATDVKWETGTRYFKATFEDQGKTLFAFYAGNGDFMGIAHNLSASRLPEELRSSIKSAYSGYWITDLFSFHNANEGGLVVTLENADEVVVLKAVDHNAWTVYKKSEKV